MLKRLTALLLALCMAFALASCGKKEPQPPVDEAKHASAQAMDVFQTLETIRHLEDMTFDLHVSHGETPVWAVSGSSYQSLHQAELQVELDGQPLTRLIVTDSQLLVNVRQMAECIGGRYGELASLNEEERADYQKEMADLVQDFPADYASFTLPEDPWSSVEQGGLSQAVDLLTEVYTSFKKDTASKVRTEKEGAVLTLGAGDLQKQLLRLTQSLEKQEDVFEKGIVTVLDEGFGTVLDAYGTDGENWFESKWEAVDQLSAELEELEESGLWTDRTIRLVTCGEEDSGFTVEFTHHGDEDRTYLLNVYPAQAEKGGGSVDSVPSQDIDQTLAELYAQSLFYRTLRQNDSTSLEELPEGYESEGEDLDDLNESTRLESQPIEGRRYIESTVITTEDGVDVTVPVPAKYDTAEAEQDSGYVSDIFLASNGFEMEYSNLEYRGTEEMVRETLDAYNEIFPEDYGFPITQKAEVTAREDGVFAVGGMGYLDKEKNQDVTIITGVLAVPDSEYCIGVDIFLYSRSVTDQDISAIQELLEHLGVKCPVSIVKN